MKKVSKEKARKKWLEMQPDRDIIKLYITCSALGVVRSKDRKDSMLKSKALELFLRKEVKAASQGFVIRCMDYLKKEKVSERKKEFVKNFQTVMDMCVSLPEESRFLQITLMRSRALLHKPFFILEAFPEGLYLTEPGASIEMDLWWLYHEYSQFCEEIDREAKKYVLCLDKLILDRIKLAELAECRMIIKYLFQGTVAAIIDTSTSLH